MFHKKTCTGLLTNFYSFVPFSYKSGLIRILIDRTFKINNTWAGFHLDITNLIKTLKRDLFPSNIIENVVRKFLNNNFTSDSSQSAARKENCFYFKLPYIGPFSITTQRRIKKSVNTFSSNLDIKLVFTPFKIKSWFGSRILSLRVYDRELFISFHVQAVVRYVGETNRHVATRIREHLSSHKHSHIFTHLRGSENCRFLVQKIVLKFLTLLPQASNWKSRKPCTSFGSSCL